MTYVEGLRALSDCVECPQWIQMVLASHIGALHRTLKEIYEGYDKDDNALYDALNRHGEMVRALTNAEAP